MTDLHKLNMQEIGARLLKYCDLDYRQQVVKVFLVLRREGVHRVIGSGHSIHKGRQGPIHHLEERVSDGISK